MIILLDGYGNHSNKLFQTIHFEAFCLENHLWFNNLALLEMIDLFPATNGQFRRIVYPFFKRLNKTEIIPTCHANNPQEIESYRQRILSSAIIFVKGWYFRVPELTVKYHDHFIKRYTLKEKYWSSDSSVTEFNRLREKQKDQLFIAVHLRKKDYIQWLDGKFFFSNDTYLSYINQLEQKAIESTGKKPYFVLFSDENIELPLKENFIIEQNHWYIDQYLMGQCDYIIGPPSTFSLWVSYIYKIKYYHFIGTNDEINWSNFTFCNKVNWNY